jgi:hypothetical protein
MNPKSDKRLKAYNLKNILFYIFINDYKNIESYLISIIKNKYTIASGREFFYCNDKEQEIILLFFITLTIKSKKINCKTIAYT